MRKGILSLIISIIIAVPFGYFIAYAAAKSNTNAYNEHTKHGVIVNIGKCHGGGFFQGSYKCAVKVKVNGYHAHWHVYGPVSIGQTVYKNCYYEDRIRLCYRVAFQRKAGI